MVGKTYKVLFTRLAHRRRKEIYHFELSLNGQAYARRVQKAIGEASKKLETFPQAFPNYTYHDTDFEIRVSPEIVF